MASSSSRLDADSDRDESPVTWRLHRLCLHLLHPAHGLQLVPSAGPHRARAEVRVEAVSPRWAHAESHAESSAPSATFASFVLVAGMSLMPISLVLTPPLWGSTPSPTCSRVASALEFMRHGGGCARAKGLDTNCEICAGFGCRFGLCGWR
jgi:hypothetical protein